MTRYRVGPRSVAGVPPGDVLELTENTELNVPALIKAGHLTPLPIGQPVPRRKKEGDG